MSTKTLRKRIALTSVVALAAGLVSVAPANAVTTWATVAGTSVAPSSNVALASGSGAVQIYVNPSAATVNASVIKAVVTVVAPSGAGAVGTAPVVTCDATTGLTGSAAAGAHASTGGLVFTDAGTVHLTASAANLLGTCSFPTATIGTYKVVVTPTNGGGGDTVTATTGSTVTYITAGYSVDSVAPNAALAKQGTNIVTGFSTTTNGQATVRLTNFAAAARTYYISSPNATILSVDDANGDVAGTLTKGYTNGTTYSAGATLATTTGTVLNDWVDVQILVGSTTSATLNVVYYDSTTGVQTTFAAPVVTIGTAPVVNAANSTAYLSAGTDCAASDDSGGVTISKTGAAAAGATICIAIKDQNGAAINGQALSATITGPGLIKLVTSNTTGTQATVRAASLTATDQAATNLATLSITADGTSGVGTITITSGTTTIATKKITFYGSAAKYTATTILNAKADGTSTTDAVVVCAVDSNGVAVPSATIYAFSGDLSVASVEASDSTVAADVVEDVDTGSAGTVLVSTAYQAAKAAGCAGFTVTGASQTTKDSVVITFRDAAASADATVSTTATVKVGGVSAASVTISSDKSSYTTGEKATLTLAFKDAYGRLVGAGAGTGTLDAALVASASLTGDALFATANNTKLGVATAAVYLPWNAGTVIITGTTGANATYLDSAARGVSLSKSITVKGAADSTSAQIASLISKINALSKLIAKIQKKLGIK